MSISLQQNRKREQKQGDMIVSGGLLTSSKGIQGCFRPHGMHKWLDDYKLNTGVAGLYIIHNDIYIDIQHNYFNKEELIKPFYYIKLFRIKPYRYGFLALEASQDNGSVIHDIILGDFYFKLPKIIFRIISPFLERKYISIFYKTDAKFS